MTTVNYKNNNVAIAGVSIDENIFHEEKVGYMLVDRENEIDELYRMISECGYDKENDKFLMVQDQDFLKSIDDEFVFSNIGTNEFIAQSINTKHFNTICVDILRANGTPEDEIKDLVSFEKERGVFRVTFMGKDLLMDFNPSIISSTEFDHYSDTLTQSIMDGDDSGEISFDGFTYWWKEEEVCKTIDTIYEVTQHEIHGERLCSFGMFTDRDVAFNEAVKGFERLYTDFEVSLIENGDNQWLYHGLNRSNGVDVEFMFCITEVTLNVFEEL